MRPLEKNTHLRTPTNLTLRSQRDAGSSQMFRFFNISHSKLWRFPMESGRRCSLWQFWIRMNCSVTGSVGSSVNCEQSCVRLHGEFLRTIMITYWSDMYVISAVDSDRQSTVQNSTQGDYSSLEIMHEHRDIHTHATRARAHTYLEDEVPQRRQVCNWRWELPTAVRETMGARR